MHQTKKGGEVFRRARADLNFSSDIVCYGARDDSLLIPSALTLNPCEGAYCAVKMLTVGTLHWACASRHTERTNVQSMNLTGWLFLVWVTSVAGSLQNECLFEHVLDLVMKLPPQGVIELSS